MPQFTVDETAVKIASRVKDGSTSFDPITIITIITTVLPLIMKCFMKNDEPTPEQVNAAVKKQHESAPEVLRRRTARRIRGEAEQPMTRHDALLMADAVIAEACETPADEVAALCSSVVGA